MIKNWLTRYTLRYPRSLVYMLQASEYSTRDYLNWYHQTKDFTRVERRKQLVRTPKSLLMLSIAWLIIFLLAGTVVYLFWSGAANKYAFLLLIIVSAPFILAYGIIIPLLVIQAFIQWPIQYVIIRQARNRLRSHAGLKIAIAGSYGKTSMREILRTVLSQGKKVAAPPHSYNTPLGISQFIKGLKGDEEVLVFEFGEYYPGDIRALCELVQPDMGIITGINEAHLEKFKSLKKTAGTIFELAQWLGNKPLYFNADNELTRKNAAVSHIGYSRRGVGGWKVENPVTGLAGTEFTLAKNDQKIFCSSRLIGLHQVGPLTAAVDIAVKVGMPLDEIQKGVRNTKPFDHRLLPTTDSSGVTTLDDSYNGNPDGVKAVIDFLADLKDCRRFYVTPGLVEMGPKSEAVHKEIGHELAKARIEKVVLIRNSVTHWIERGLKESNYHGEVLWFDDALTAFASLPHLTVKGDVVLLQNDWPDQYQ